MGIVSEQAEVQSKGRTNNWVWFNSNDFGIPCNDFPWCQTTVNYPAFEKALYLVGGRDKGRI